MELHTHFDIPCSIESKPLCETVAMVLRQIRQRAPDDFMHLQNLVSGFAPLRNSQLERVRARFEGHGKCPELDFSAPGEVRIREGIADAVAVVAHELGHACTREDDFEDRLNNPLGEACALELCANYYAFKWGFEEQITRADRDVLHQGPLPGGELTEGPDPKSGVVNRYRVTRDFIFEFVQAETASGDCIETAAERDQRLRQEFQEQCRKRGIDPAPKPRA